MNVVLPPYMRLPRIALGVVNRNPPLALVDQHDADHRDQRDGRKR